MNVMESERRLVKSLRKLDSALVSCSNRGSDTYFVNAFISESVEHSGDEVACRFLLKVGGSNQWVYTGYKLVGNKFILNSISGLQVLKSAFEDVVNEAINYVDDIGKSIDFIEFTLVGKDDLVGRGIKIIHKGISENQLSFFISYGDVKNRNTVRDF